MNQLKASKDGVTIRVPFSNALPGYGQRKRLPTVAEARATLLLHGYVLCGTRQKKGKAA